MLEEALHVDLGFVDHGEQRVGHLAEVVRRDVRRHADRDPGRAVHEQLREVTRQDDGLFERRVVVGAPLDGVRTEIGQHLLRDRGELGLRVAVGSGLVAIE